MEKNNEDKKKGFAQFVAMIGMIVKVLSASISFITMWHILKYNKRLTIAARLYPALKPAEKWVKFKSRICVITAVITLGFSGYIINRALNMDNVIANDIVKYSKTLKEYQLRYLIKNPALLVPSVSTESRTVLLVTAILISVPLLLLLIIATMLKTGHPAYRKSITLFKKLKEKKYIEDDAKISSLLLLVTDLGVLLHTPGVSFVDISNDKSFWNSVNFEPGEVYPDPDDKSIFFVETKYNLKSVILYEY